MTNFYIVSRRVSALFICVFLANMLFAQTTNIQGRVTDNTGNPLSNVSILIKAQPLAQQLLPMAAIPFQYPTQNRYWFSLM